MKGNFLVWLPEVSTKAYSLFSEHIKLMRLK